MECRRDSRKVGVPKYRQLNSAETSLHELRTLLIHQSPNLGAATKTGNRKRSFLKLSCTVKIGFILKGNNVTKLFLYLNQTTFQYTMAMRISDHFQHLP